MQNAKTQNGQGKAMPKPNEKKTEATEKNTVTATEDKGKETAEKPEKAAAAHKPEELEEARKAAADAQNIALKMGEELNRVKAELAARKPTNPAEMQSKAVSLFKLNEKLIKINSKKKELELYSFTDSGTEEMLLKSGDEVFRTTNTEALRKVKQCLLSFLQEKETETLRQFENAFYFEAPNNK